MKNKQFDSVEMKRRLQKEAEQKLSDMTIQQQLELLSRKFGHLNKKHKMARVS